MSTSQELMSQKTREKKASEKNFDMPKSECIILRNFNARNGKGVIPGIKQRFNVNTRNEN